MSKNNFSNVYDDDNIPEVDLPRDNTNTNAANSMTNRSGNRISNSMTSSSSANSANTDNTDNTGKPNYNVEPLPESSRPRKDGPGGA